MLRIETPTQRLALKPDISISLTIENPLCNSSELPVPHSLSFTIPTAPNAAAFGWPHLINSSIDLSAKVAASIYFGAVLILKGVLTVDQADQREITVQFVGVIFPGSLRKHLQNQNLGSLNYGTAAVQFGTYINTSAAQLAYNNRLTSEFNKSNPDFVAPVIAINDVNYYEGQIDAFQYSSYGHDAFLNYYRNDYLPQEISPTGERSNISKIILSVPVYRIINSLFNGQLKGYHPFISDLKKLLLVGIWHPAYQVNTRSPVFDLDKYKNISLQLADFMPDIAANEFIAELLKLICGSLFISGDTFTIETNEVILQSTDIVDWSDKLLDGYSISRQAGVDYVVGFSNSEDEQLLTDRAIIEVSTILNMIEAKRDTTNDAPITYYVTSTNQYFEAYLNATLSNEARPHWDFKLLKQDLGGTKQTPESIDDRGSFDMTVNAEVVSTNVVTETINDHRYDSLTPTKQIPAEGLDPDVEGEGDGEINPPPEGSLYRRFYCPSIDRSKSRSDKILLGLWHGLRTVFDASDYRVLVYPAISHSMYDVWGQKRSDVNLSFSGENGLLAKYHNSYKAWIEKDKKSIKGKMNFTAIDLHRLDMRKKFNIKGIICILKSVDVELKLLSIEPSDVEFLEV